MPALLLEENKKEEFDSDAAKRSAFMQDITDDADVLWEQIGAANEDMRFIHADDGMWQDWFENVFQNRSKLVFDSTSPVVNRFMGNWFSNRIGVEFKSDDKKGKTSEQDANFLNGVFRSDYQKFSGNEAVDNAVHEAAICGYGTFRFSTAFDDETDPANDAQHPIWIPQYNSFMTVYWDNAAQRADKRDARWVTILKPFTKDSFEKAYPGKTASSAYSPWENTWADWDWGLRREVIYVAHRYEKSIKDETFIVYHNLETGEVETYSEEKNEELKREKGFGEFRKKVRERVLKIPQIEKTVFSGQDILKDTKRINGNQLPVIPFYGYRGYVNTTEWYKGLVRAFKDPNRVVNVLASQILENAQSGGQNVPIVYPEQIQDPNIAANIADRNNKSYMVIDHQRDSDGQIVPQELQYTQPPVLDQNTQQIMQFVQDYMNKAGTIVPQEIKDSDISGKALRELRKIEDMHTKPIMENIAKSLEWSGEVYKGIAMEIYNDDRMMDLISEDGTESQQTLTQINKDEETGKLVQTNSLEGKKFRAFADTGPQFETEREDTVETLKGAAELFKDMPGAEKYMPALVAGIISNLSGVGLEPIQKIARMDMIMQGLIQPETDEEKQELAEAQQEQQQDPQAELIQAAAEQAKGESEERRSKVVDNLASAEKKGAETEKILRELPLTTAKTASEIRKTESDIQQNLFENVPGLPLQ